MQSIPTIAIPASTKAFTQFVDKCDDCLTCVRRQSDGNKLQTVGHFPFLRDGASRCSSLPVCRCSRLSSYFSFLRHCVSTVPPPSPSLISSRTEPSHLAAYSPTNVALLSEIQTLKSHMQVFPTWWILFSFTSTI